MVNMWYAASSVGVRPRSNQKNHPLAEKDKRHKKRAVSREARSESDLFARQTIKFPPKFFIFARRKNHGMREDARNFQKLRENARRCATICDDARRCEKCEKMREGLREMREKKRANLCHDARNARNARNICAGMRERARRCENVRGIPLKIPGKSASRGSSSPSLFLSPARPPAGPLFLLPWQRLQDLAQKRCHFGLTSPIV